MRLEDVCGLLDCQSHYLNCVVGFPANLTVIRKVWPSVRGCMPELVVDKRNFSV